MRCRVGGRAYAARMRRSVSRSAIVLAPPEEVFALLADPRRHHEVDGSRTVRGVLRAPERLGPGARFGMRMRFGVPYVITNTVVEFEENRRIAWRHLGHHVWRYVLEPVDRGTRVTETFDWGSSRTPRLLELLGYPVRNAKSIEQTLQRLADCFRSGRPLLP